MRYHRNFGHAPFKKLQKMAKDGIIPKLLANCKIPACSACIMGQMGRRRWRRKPSNTHEGTIITKIGAVVSVDMLVSPTPGLVAQMESFLTKKKTNMKQSTLTKHPA